MIWSVYYQNVNGLRTKSNNFYQNVLNNNSEIICLTETNLSAAFFDSEFFPTSFSIFRKDRQHESKVRGGGVIVAVSSALASRSREDLSSGVEEVWVEIKGPDRSLIVCCVYLPPADDAALTVFTKNVTNIINNHPDTAFLITGDFNIPDVDWVTHSHSYLTPTLSNSLRGRLLRDTINLCSLTQYNHIRNAGGRILDLILLNNNNSLILNVQAAEPLVPEDRHHPAVEFNVKIDMPKPLKNNPILIPIFRKTNYIELRRCLSAIDWHVELSSLSTEDATIQFYTKISNLINRFVPKRKLRSGKYPSWYSRATIRVLKEKRKVHRKWKIYSNERDKLTFNLLRGRAQFLITQDFNVFLNSVQESIIERPQYLWNYISKRKQSTNIPNIIEFNNETAENGQSIAVIFNKYFSSVFEPSNVNTLITEAHIRDTFGAHLIITRPVIKEKLDHLDVKKGAGPDNLPPCILRECSPYFIEPLHILFNKSISEGHIPSIWKQSYVIPIYKSGDRKLATNYRPISILCTCLKILDSILYEHVFRSVESHLIPQQHGFFPSRSTDSNLVTYTTFILSNIDSRVQVDSVYTDYAKAFDKLDHYILINKLIKIGIKGDLLRWLKSYVCNRSQVVKLNGYFSNSALVTSGVPQGSHLAPLLFNIYINDIYKCFQHSSFLEYADDLKIFRPIRNVSDCLALQSDIDNLCHYCQNNKLSLNISKCKVIQFTRNKNKFNFKYNINGSELEQVDSIRDLGVVLDGKLAFDEHVEYVVNKANKMLGFIIRSTKLFANIDCIKSLYYSYVYSTLNYASVVWSPSYAVHSDRIESVQKRFLRYLSYKASIDYERHTVACRNFNMLPLKSKRMQNDMMFLFKILNNEFDSPDLLFLISFNVPVRETRDKSLFYLPRCNTNSIYHSPLYRSMAGYNGLFSGIDIFATSKYAFKKSIRSRLCNEL